MFAWPSRSRSLDEISQDLVRCLTFYLHDTGVGELLRSISEDQGQYSLARAVNTRRCKSCWISHLANAHWEIL